jgi:hypothetical protein
MRAGNSMIPPVRCSQPREPRIFAESKRIIVDRNVFGRNSAAGEPARLTLWWDAAQQEPLMSNAAFDLSSAHTNLGLDVASVFAERESERYALHVRYMNEMMVRVLRTIGYDVGFRSGKGPCLFDSAGERPDAGSGFSTTRSTVHGPPCAKAIWE